MELMDRHLGRSAIVNVNFCINRSVSGVVRNGQPDGVDEWVGHAGSGGVFYLIDGFLVRTNG